MGTFPGSARGLALGVLLLGAVSLHFAFADETSTGHAGTEVVAASDSHAPGEAMTVKLRPGLKRKRSEVLQIIDRLKKLPGMEGVAWTAAGRDTVVMSLSAKNKPMELKDELLKDQDVHEVDIGSDTYRREGDKPHIELRKEIAVERRKKLRETLAERIKDLFGRKRKKVKGDGDGAPAEALEDGSEGEGDKGQQQQQRLRRKRRADGRRRRRKQGQLGNGGQGEL